MNPELWLTFLMEQAATQLRANRANLVSVLDKYFANHAVNVYWSDDEGVYQWCNPSQAAYAGTQGFEGIQGKTIFDFCDEASASMIYQQDLSLFRSHGRVVRYEAAHMTSGVLLRTVSAKQIMTLGNTRGMLGMSMPLHENPFDRLRINLKRAGLSKQQALCLVEIVKGHSAAQVATTLGISKRTVESYLDVIKDKLCCSTRQAMVEKALQEHFPR